jgi:hypothetical protein
VCVTVRISAAAAPPPRQGGVRGPRAACEHVAAPDFRQDEAEAQQGRRAASLRCFGATGTT